MPESIYINDENMSLLNRLVAIKGFKTYEEAIKYVVDQYYLHILEVINESERNR